MNTTANSRDYNAEYKDNERKYAYDFDNILRRYMLRSFLPFMGDPTNRKALEMGCYKGEFTEMLTEYFEDLTVIEAAGELVEYTRNRVSDKVKFIHSTFEEYHEEGQYDYIFLMHTLEHLDDAVGILEKVKSWLTDDGVLYLVCPNANAPSRQIAVKMGLISHNSAVTPAEKEHGHRNTYSLDTLEREATAAGLTTINRGGIFFKALANFQFDKLMGTDIISDGYLEGCYKLGMLYPDLCASIYLICKKIIPESMQPIGGFFEWEMPHSGQPYFPVERLLASGRACFRFLLDQLQPEKVYVPFYTCDSLLIPLEDSGVKWAFYAVNEALELDTLPELGAKDILVYIDYFGLKETYSQQLAQQFPGQLILDHTQAFFTKCPKGAYAFNSARKFFGVPDGAYVLGDVSLEGIAEMGRLAGFSDHLRLRLEGEQQAGYAAFLEQEARIPAANLRASQLAERMLAKIDYAAIQARRRENFAYLHTALAAHNRLKVDFALTESAIPMSYPFLPAIPLDRTKWYASQVFIPLLWKDTLVREGEGFDWDRHIAREVLPLPIDQRLDRQALDRMLQLVLHALAIA